uniref:hypothetical protein n=1 Tax=Mammaliicoccus sciuri TaxID=1296 RepID=UPI00001B50CA|nr:hypothetical protein [Mammaliicoccus sciuri]CAE18148.1 truncated transposase B of Tn554 [Mammaliicoccus sciuri]
MKEKIYTIKNLCDELNQPRQKVRRRLEKLEIKAINKDTRIYENESLEYDHQAFLKLAEEFDVRIDNKECTASVPQHEEQLERTEELLAIAKDKQWQRQVETNSRVKERLEQIIGSLTG